MGAGIGVWFFGGFGWVVGFCLFFWFGGGGLEGFVLVVFLVCLAFLVWFGFFCKGGDCEFHSTLCREMNVGRLKRFVHATANEHGDCAVL